MSPLSFAAKLIRSFRWTTYP